MKTEKFVWDILRYKKDYTPFSLNINDYLFLRLEEILIEVEQWESALEIDRNLFEELIKNQSYLVDEYVELYEKKSRFFTSQLELFDNTVLLFYCMVFKQRIVLIFYIRSTITEPR